MTLNSSLAVAAQPALASEYNDLREDVLIGAGDYATAAGTADVLTLAVDAQVVALANGMRAKFKAASNNADAVTININSIGAKSIKDVAGNDLAPMAIIADGLYDILYDSTLDYWVLLNSLPADNKSVFTAGEAINASSSPKGVYVKASDGKVYLTDADDTGEQLESFLGFVTLGQNVSADDVVYVQTDGVVSGFSGLTIGDELSLASAGTSPSDINETSVVTHDVYVGYVGSRHEKAAFYIEATDNMWVEKLSIDLIGKNGTPNDMRITLMQVGGLSSGLYGEFLGQCGMIPLKEWTLSNAESFPLSDFELEINMRFKKGERYAILFEQYAASTGGYYELKGDPGTSAYWKDANTNTSPYWQWTGAYLVACTLYTDSEAFTNGDLSNYFFDYKKPVAIAISATEVLLKSGINGTDDPILYDYTISDTWVEVKTDGLLLLTTVAPGGSSGGITVFFGTVSGESGVETYLIAHIAGGNYGDRANQVVPVKKGQYFRIESAGGLFWHYQFTPNNL